MILSKRLQAIANMVNPGEVVADIGTDHGYIPIYLIQEGICKHTYACDINKGPYEKAKQHIASYGLSDKIEVRLSDGMKALKASEATTVIIAGMGGALVNKILDQDRRLWESLQYVILQPQSEIDKVRRYLQENNWSIIQEDMIFEDGKYYPMMKAVKGASQPYTTTELEFGPLLIKESHPVLLEFVNREKQLKETVLEKLRKVDSDNIEQRIKEIQDELEVCYEVCRTYQ